MSSWSTTLISTRLYQKNARSTSWTSFSAHGVLLHQWTTCHRRESTTSKSSFTRRSVRKPSRKKMRERRCIVRSNTLTSQEAASSIFKNSSRQSISLDAYSQRRKCMHSSQSSIQTSRAKCKCGIKLLEKFSLTSMFLLFQLVATMSSVVSSQRWEAAATQMCLQCSRWLDKSQSSCWINWELNWRGRVSSLTEQ